MRKKIANELSNELSRLHFEYTEEMTEIKLLSDLEDIDFGGVEFNGGKTDKHIKLPFYLAKCLVKNEQAEWVDSPFVDISQLYSFISREQRESAIQQIGKYTDISLVHQLNEAKHDSDLTSQDYHNSERERMLAGFRRFLRNRVHKITRMASQRTHRGLAVKVLTAYELIFFDYITRVIEEWEKNILSLEVGNQNMDD